MPSVVAHHYADECPGVPNAWPVVVHTEPPPELTRLGRRVLGQLAAGPLPSGTLAARVRTHRDAMAGALSNLRVRRLVRQDDAGRWHLTTAGRAAL